MKLDKVGQVNSDGFLYVQQVWSLQVLVQLMIMHGELDLENMEIQWTTVAREYCQRHFNLDGNYRCS